MRTKATITQLQQEITATDLAVRHLKQQVMTQLQTIITLKKALQAPLTLSEQDIFDALPAEIQSSLNKSADLIASTLRTNLSPRTVNMSMYTPSPQQAATRVVEAMKHQNKEVTYTITQPKRQASPQPLSRTRWTAKEDATLRKMVKQGKSMQEIATVLQRSVKACQLHWNIIRKQK